MKVVKNTNIGGVVMGANAKKINRDDVFFSRFLEQNSKKPRTLEELGALFGASRQTVANWLNGMSFPNADALVRMAEFYNVSADYLLGLSDTKSADVGLKAAVEYTGLSEEAVEWLHMGLDDVECDGEGLAEESQKANLATASALIQDRAFTKMIHHLKEISQEAYLEKILKILYDEYSECDLPEEDPDFKYAKKEDRDIVAANYIHILVTKTPWEKEEIQELVSGMDDEALSCDVVRAMFSAEESNELHQFHAAKAFTSYIDQLVEKSIRRAERRFKKTEM